MTGEREERALDRGVAQFFFEIGYGACWAEAFVRADSKPPFPLTDALVERAWEIAGEAHDDPAEFDAYLARAAVGDDPQERDAAGEGEVSAVDAFDMGYAWAMSLRGQTMEDSRAVGRTLTSQTFEAIAPQIDAATKEQGFDSFQCADLGICAAKRIIHAAFAEPTPPHR